MKQDSKRIVSLLLALGLIVVALVIFFDLIQPEYGNISQTKGEIIAENALYDTEAHAITVAQNVISQYHAEQTSGTIALALPTNQDVAGTIAQIYGLAQNNNLVIQSLGISSPSLIAQKTPLAGSTSSTSITKPLGSFSLQVSAAGSYENFKNFLAGLETNIRIFDVKDVTIAPVASNANIGKNGLPTTSDFFNYSVTVVTYYQTN